MIKLSIIVPIYNVAPYLRMCVASLLDQDLARDEYEIILVDDGSTDACPQICDEYSKLYTVHQTPLIRVIHQKNGGLSAARNSGIKIAQGEYIMCVDSDDYLQRNVLRSLLEQMENQKLDVLRYNYNNVREDGSIFEPFKNVKPYFDYSSEVVDGETFLNERLGYACYAWAFILRRDLIYTIHHTPYIENNDTLFTEGIYFEDTDWTPRMLMKAKRVASTEIKVYNYLWREGSITLPKSEEKKQKILDDRMKLLCGFQEQRKLVKDDRWFKWQTAGLTISLLTTIASFPKSKRDNYMQQIKALNIFPLTTYRAVGNNKYKIRLANISPSLFCKLMRIIRK